MRSTRVLAITVAMTTGALCAVTAASQTLDPPGPTLPRDPHLYAVALEDGTLYRNSDVASDEITEFRRGHIFEYLGGTLDTFGRDWHSVGNGDAWLRTERWYSIPATADEALNSVGPVSVLTSLPAPRQVSADGPTNATAAAAYSASLQQAIAVRPGWWDETIEIDADALGQFGRIVGLSASRVPSAVAEDIEKLLGAGGARTSWPQEPGLGRLHVEPRTGMVYRFDGGGWHKTTPPLTMEPMVGLLANPRLSFAPDTPPEATGRLISCWSLVGGLSPRGALAGRIAPAPPSPARLQTSARPDEDRYLGYYNLAEKAWPTAVPATLAPRRVLPAPVSAGVLLEDASRRQAVYLEQVIPAAITRQLRGREVHARLMARAPVDGGGATATVAIELEAGSTREAASAQVGALSTPVTLHLVIPEDAETITVRVLPADVSIAVLEGGSAIIDGVTVVPAEWPDELEAAPLLLRRVHAVAYRPTPRYTRAALVITARSPAELETIWREVADEPDERIEKILSGEVEANMPERHVRLAWGDPDTETEGGLTQWTWADRAASFDEEGRLLAWSRKPEHEPEQLSICAASTVSSHE